MEADPGKRLQSQLQRLARNGMALAAGGILAQLAFTFLEILVARKLGAHAYGTFVTAYAWTLLGSHFMGFGTPMWTIQEGSRRPSQLPSLLGCGLTLNVAIFLALYALLAVIASMSAASPVTGFLLLLLPYGLILTVQDALAAVYSSYQTMAVNAFFQGIAPAVILLTYLAYSTNEIALAEVAYAYVIGGGIVTGMWFAVTLRKFRPTVSRESFVTTFRSSYQYGLSGILGQVYIRMDIVMLSALAGVREAGTYAAAYKLVDLVFKVAVLSGRVFAPALFKASHDSDKSFGIFASMMIRLLAIAGIVAGMFSFVLADELILLMFGENYAASAPVLRILGGVMAVRCMMVALQLLVSSIDLHFQRTANTGITVVAHICANLVLVPRLGAEGAAWATLLSGALIVTLHAFSSSRRRKFQFMRSLVVPSCLALVFAFGANAFEMNVYLQAMASVSVFVASLLVTGFVQPHEIDFVRRSLFARTAKQA